jgi:hypothetical protein
MLSNNSAQQNICKIIYIVKKNAQNNLLVVISFINFQNSNEITFLKTNKPSTTVGKLAGGSRFARTANTTLNSLENFRDDYHSHIHNTYNKKYDFSNSPDSFKLDISIKLIEKPENHINYLKLLNSIPTLTFLEDICSAYSIVDLDLSEYSDTIIIL